MSLRELVLLGTGSQVPGRLRNHNSLFLYWDELGILFPAQWDPKLGIHVT